jgi:hypothetical protein
VRGAARSAAGEHETELRALDGLGLLRLLRARRVRSGANDGRDEQRDHERIDASLEHRRDWKAIRELRKPFSHDEAAARRARRSDQSNGE